MIKKRSIFKRFTQNIRRVPRRIGRFSSRLDAAFGKALFGDEDSSDRRPSHVVATVACSLVASYGVSRLFGFAFAKRLPGLEGDSLLASGWGGMLVILVLLAGFNTVTLLLLIDRQVQGGNSATHRIATAIVAFVDGDDKQAPVKSDQRS